MASNRMRRIAKELADLEKDQDSSNIRAEAADGNGADLSQLVGYIPGSPDTPYEGGTYSVEIKIPTEYPFKPPTMRFITKIWHPNISSQTGAICLDTLGKHWSPVLTIKSTLLSLQSLFESPEPSDPQDAYVAKLMKQDLAKHNVTAHEWAVKYANAPYDPKWQGVRSPTAAPAAEDTAKYCGYNPRLFQTFTAMGFEERAIAKAFASCRIHKDATHIGSIAREVIAEKLLGGT